MVNFDCSKADQVVIHRIAKRAAAALDRRGEAVDLMSLEMDITAAHASGCPLRLDDLLAADDLDFAHDVFGIHRHINRETGGMGDGFHPRYAVRQD